MCGIIGFIGNDANIHVYNGLEQLQNRGYDSIGISTIIDNVVTTTKCASTENTYGFEKIKETLKQHNNSKCGIGHTRWATHGAKTDANSHPHTSSDGIFTLVHNGIIENYAVLKQMLIKEGYIFQSETDTEVIVNLLSYCYSKTNCVKTSIKDTVSKMEGTWGLAIICKNTPNTIYCTKHGSPILISINDGFAYIASEQTGFCNLATNYFALQDADICTIQMDSINKISYLTEQSISLLTLNTQSNALSPHPYPHWTIKEIYEQIESSDRAISLGGRLCTNNTVRLGGLDSIKDKLLNIEHIILLGCGTSYHAGMIGINVLKRFCNFNTVQLFDGAEFSEHDIPKSGKTAFVLLSQSGETKDLHRCIEIGNKHNVVLIGVVNAVDSLIAREVHGGCYLNAGREVGVASTKAFSSQVIILYLIAVWFSQETGNNGRMRQQIISDLRHLSQDIQTAINMSMQQIEYILPLFDNQDKCFILGKEQSEAIAKEGALKIKEISYIHAEGYSTSSLKHGPFALLKEKFPVILISNDDAFYAKNENAYEEIKSRHANIIVISDKADIDKPYMINIPYNKTFKHLLSVIPLQILSYKLSLQRGLNPDMPRNLAKVVTVE